MNAVLADRLFDRLDAAELITDPWSHVYLPDALPEQLSVELFASFASFGFTAYRESARAKTYQFRTTEIHGPAAKVSSSGPLHAAVTVLASAAYRRRMSRLTGLPLDDAVVTVDLWEYHPGDWLAPHVDKADKIVTQIFYLTDNWDSDDGGRLLILSDSSVDSVSSALPPRLGSSAVLVRSEDSWHAVEAPGPRSAVRRSITATFWRGDGPRPRDKP